MTREDIIRMAREAACGWARNGTEPVLTGEIQIERFAALVAAYIRETEFKPDWNNYRQGLVDGAAAEREACARVCEAFINGSAGLVDNTAQVCANAIRDGSKA